MLYNSYDYTTYASAGLDLHFLNMQTWTVAYLKLHLFWKHHFYIRIGCLNVLADVNFATHKFSNISSYQHKII